MLAAHNVPGIYHSGGGRDLLAVLETIIGIVEPSPEVPAPENWKWPYVDCYLGDGWSLAYRALEASKLGVPQRRKRIYLVADLGGARAPEILFKSDGVSGFLRRVEKRGKALPETLRLALEWQAAQEP